MRLTCERCRTVFTAPPSAVARGRRWCSRDCHTPPFEVAVWDRLDIGDCWEWTGPTDQLGYGKIATKHGGLVHRAIWTLLVGPLEDGQPLDHLCRNTRCVNPEHLEPVTHRENILRGYGTGAKYARRRCCARGHPLAGPGSDVTITKGRGRRCNICNRERTREWRESRRC